MASLQDLTKYRKPLKIFLSILKTWPRCKGLVIITLFDMFSSLSWIVSNKPQTGTILLYYYTSTSNRFAQYRQPP